MTLPELLATASVMIVAGSETTVNVLSSTTNYLVKNSDKLAFMTAEVRGTFVTEGEITLFVEGSSILECGHPKWEAL